MGVEYALVKIATGDAYELGKTAIRPPLADWKKRTKGLHTLRDSTALMEALQPSEYAMWRIGTDTQNIAVIVLADRFDEEALANLIETATLQEDDRPMALAIARDVLTWAGQDPLILLPDTLSTADLSAKLGIKIARPRVVRTIYDVVRPGDAVDA